MVIGARGGDGTHDDENNDDADDERNLDKRRHAFGKRYLAPLRRIVHLLPFPESADGSKHDQNAPEGHQTQQGLGQLVV